MPEVIEVKSYSDFIKKYTLKKKLLSIKIISGRYKNHKPFNSYNSFNKSLPLKIINVNTKGKFMYIEFSNGQYIGVTLGLSGGWFYKKNNKYIHGLTQEFINTDISERYLENALKHINVEFYFKNGILSFYDMLSFGTIKIFNKSDLQKKLNEIGPDLLDLNTTFDIFKNKIFNKKNNDKPIGNVLLDQKIISGVGNYLRADGLYLAKISPFRTVVNINNKELLLLYNKLRLLIWGQYNYNKAISNNIIKKIDKLPQDYNRDFFIYNSEKDINGHPVTKEKLYTGSQVRYIYWVNKIQK